MTRVSIFFISMIITCALLSSTFATLDSALRIHALAADNCFAHGGYMHIWRELNALLPDDADVNTVARSLYALSGALRAGRSVCSAIISAASQRSFSVNAIETCRSNMGAARANARFSTMDPLIVCLKTGYQRGGLLALVQTREEEDARAANAAAAAAASANVATVAES